MIGKFISLGDKIELRRVEGDPEKNASGKVYTSRIYDIQEEDQISILMPMEQTKLILLPANEEFDLLFYGASGIFQCCARVTDRYKSNQVYMVDLKLTTNLRKYQRREYYRFSCALEMCSRHLETEEVQALEESRPYVLAPGLPITRSVILDISGGGLRFVSEQRYEPESLIYCSYFLQYGGDIRQYEVVCKVLGVEESLMNPGTFEHRVVYVNLDPEVREEIIHFIFEEERKLRRKERL